ncbi:GAF domain-containing protein [Streptomyces sp. NPDC058954]|uniref:GAF domain-containing protein n=1 Tax=Streptomyces sp. NPDC058954 TaxID=3346677 RepID=UPI0036CC74A2
MARVIENLAPREIKVSVLLADPDGRHLRHGAAPSLPDFYNQAIDGIATGEGVGSCGTAAHRRQIVIVSDIATDPFWDDFRDVANAAGVAACWSAPSLARDRSLLGTFAMYHTTPRLPHEADLALVRVFADTAALAIERHRAEQARHAAEAKEKAARDDLAFLLQASTRLTSDLDYTQTLQRLASSCTPRWHRCARSTSSTPAGSDPSPPPRPPPSNGNFWPHTSPSTTPLTMPSPASLPPAWPRWPAARPPAPAPGPS